MCKVLGVSKSGYFKWLKRPISDNGVTYVDANTSPGPLLPGGTPLFKYIVTNTGNVPLQNVTVTDTDFGIIAVFDLMLPGDVEEIFFP